MRGSFGICEYAIDILREDAIRMISSEILDKRLEGTFIRKKVRWEPVSERER